MRKFLRYTFILYLFLVLGTAATLITLRLLFPPEKLKALALEKLQTASGREVRLDSVQLGLGGLDLKGLEVSEVPNFSAGTFLKAAAIRVHLRLGPLLHKKLDLTDILLSGWTCRIVKNPDGTLNVSAKGAPGNDSEDSCPGCRSRGDRRAVEAPPPSMHDAPHSTSSPTSSGGKIHRASPEKTASLPSTSHSSGQPLQWTVDRIRSHDGAVDYEDKTSGIAVTLNHFELDARKIQMQGTFPIKLAFSYAGKANGKHLKGNLDYQGTIDLGGLDPARIAFHLAPLQLQYGDLPPLKASGNLRHLDAPEADIELTVPALESSGLKKLVSLPEGISIPPIDADLHIKKNKQAMVIEKTHIKTNGPLQLPGMPKLASVAIDLSGEVRGEETTVKSMQVKMGKMQLDVDGKLRTSPGRSPAVNLNVATNVFPIADFIPPGTNIHPEGTANLKVQATGTADAPVLTGHAEIQRLSLIYSGQKFNGVNASTKFSPDTISAQANGTWNNGQFDINLTAQDYRSSPNINLTGTLSELDLARALDMPQNSTQPSTSKAPSETAGSERAASPGARNKKAAPEPAETSSSALKPIKSSGKILIGKIAHPNFEASPMNFRWDLNSTNPAQLTGSAQIKIGQGKFDNLRNMDNNSSLVRALLMPIIILQKVAGLVKVPLFPAFDRVRFKDITGDYAFKNGKMTVKESHLDSDVAYVTTTGSADLAANQLNLHIDTKLGTQVGIKLGGPIGFTVRGSIDSPSIKLDVTSILKQPEVNQAIEQGKKLLNNLFK